MLMDTEIGGIMANVLAQIMILQINLGKNLLKL